MDAENVRVIVLLTATPVAVSTGSDDDISKAGTSEANLYARSIAAVDDDEAVILLLYHHIIAATPLKINT